MFTPRQWRKAKDLTQDDMAKKLNVHLNTYQNWEKEPEKISIANAVKIAEIFGISMNEISFKAQEKL